MIAEIQVSKAKGTVCAPPSKSMAHRLLICAALANGKSKIHNLAFSDDINATIYSLKALGAEFIINDNCVEVTGINIENINCPVLANCRESGSTLRFLIPILFVLGTKSEIIGSDYLLTRPLSVYDDIANKNNLIFYKSKNKINLEGKLTSGTYEIPGDISSQFISGLLFALPLANGDSKIIIKGNLESRPYVDLTVNALKTFGVNVEFITNNEIFIKGNQEYLSKDVTVEGDYSNSAFFEALNYLGSDIQIDGLNSESYQGDKVYSHYFKLIKQGTPLLDITDCPDLAPILFTLASYFNGARFIGTRRLKMKESNRAVAMKEELEKFGAEILVEEDTVTVKKIMLHKPNISLNGHNDHRIVMSLAVLLTSFGGKISGAEAVAKSFPNFFDEISTLGIGVNLLVDKF